MEQEKPESMHQWLKQKQITTRTKKKHWTLLLIPIFFFVLFMSCYFNYTSGFATNPDGVTLGTRFFLSGPDPYYNMRLVNQTLETGTYPFTQPHSPGGADPLLNYPVGERGARPPLFNMIAVSSTLVLQNFMTQIDAQGWSMLFLPAIYGALMVFPLFYIGKELFNRKVGLIAAVLLPLIPAFIGGGHGSGFSLFDHDSFIQLIFICVIFFVIKMIREQSSKRSIVYSAMAGLFVGAFYLTWVVSQMVYLVLLTGLISILIFSLFKNKDETKLIISFLVLSIVAFFVGLPWSIVFNDVIGFPLFMICVTFIVLCFHYVVRRINIPWIVSVPSIAIAGFGSLVLLFFVNLGWLNLGGRIYQLSVFFFGEGIYGSKISLTIAEAHTMGLSTSVMSVGPAIYFLGLAGFCLYIVKSYKEKFKPESIFMISLFFVLLWLLTTAGRFLNDLIPYMVLFCAWTLLVIIDKIGLKRIREPIRALGFLRGIKRGMTPLRIFGVLFLVLVVIAPNSFLALDASIPQVDKSKYFGEGYQGYFGQSLGQSYYWSDACHWLSQQDANITVDGNKPAVISWWDYGFYLSSMSEHPTVADNYQDGIFPAANFHTAKTEQEAVCVLALRCIEGASFKQGYKIPDKIKIIIAKHLQPYEKTITVVNGSHNITNIVTGETEFATNQTVTIYPSNDFINYFEDPVKYAPSYNKLIHPEYGNDQLRIKADNARYQDCCKLLENLTDEQVTNFYMDIKKETGFDIRYYAVEQYDTQIFNVFSFLADKSTMGFVTSEDDYMMTLYKDTLTGLLYNISDAINLSPEIQERLTTTNQMKSAYYETMFYRTYYGVQGDNRVPTYLLKHFSVKYLSPYVVIAKYSEGARINGSVLCDGSGYYNAYVFVLDEFKVPHDYSYVNHDGSFSLLAPEGNCSIMVALGENLVDSTTSFFVTENEARRKTNYTEKIDLSVGLSSVNITVVTNQTGLSISMDGQNFGKQFSSFIVSNRIIRFTSFYPDIYDFKITSVNGSIIHEEQRFLNTGENDILLNL